MSNIATYLNDHLAGSVAALEMLDRLLDLSEKAELHAFLQEARSLIQQGQNVLRELMQAIGVEESSTRKLGGWLVEKLSRAKLRSQDALGWFLALESLLLGLNGQASLWRTMTVLRPHKAVLAGFDFEEWNTRALALAQQVDEVKLSLAREAFLA
jgi:hypothetical protein